MTATHFAFAGAIFFAAHLVGSTSGFGSNVLGLPLLALVVGIDPGKQALVVLGVLLCAYMTVRWRSQVDLRQLAFILAVTAVGLVIGMIVAARLDRRVSAILLATFVFLVGLRGLFDLAPDVRAPAWARKVMLFLGGVVHGAFTTGGPVLVVYCQRALPDKSVFRATLSVMWLLLGIGLMMGWTLSHEWDPQTPRLCLVGLPFMLGGLVVGEYLHHRVDERRFRSVVNLTLIAVGIVLALTALR
jgi:uncharacterized membrane protein YfcA